MAKTFTSEELLSRWEDQREIKNLMGRLSQDYTLKKEGGMFRKYWSARDDVSLGVNNGWFTGPNNVAAYYASEADRVALESRLIQAAFPEQLGDKTPEEVYGVGMMTYRPVDTPVIELAEDGQTAKGLWTIRGSYSQLTPGGPQGFWEWGWFAVDFIREGDDWKIWHMQYLKEIDRPCGSPWVGAPRVYEDIPEFAAMRNFRPVDPDVRAELRAPYAADRPFTPAPRMPEPYTAFADTFSYGI